MGVIDLTGQQFGRLTALERAEKPEGIKSRNAYWLCQCDCGNTAIVDGSHLRSGNTKSCGCLHKKIISNNLIGKKFGHLTVIKDSGLRDSKRAILWECQCDCKNKTIIRVRGYDLKRGKTCSCGCHRSKGEDEIAKILSDNNIPYIQQYSPDNFRFSKTNSKCFFDFYVNNNYIIEFDGEQHFHIGNNGWYNEQSYLDTKARDHEKNQYCFKYNIPIIRIPYTLLSKITLDDLKIDKSKYLLKEEGKNE